MTSLPPLAQGPDASEFPIGGRPQEWRALEEAAAFDKWFEQEASAGRDSSGRSRVEVIQEERNAARAAPRAARELVSVRHDIAWEAMTSQGLRVAETAGSAVARAGFTPRTSHAAVAIVPAQATEPAAAADSVATTRGPQVGRHAWSRLALTALVDDRRVRVWLRDYRLSPTELDQLQRELGDELRRLGYRLAQLVVNGEERK